MRKENLPLCLVALEGVVLLALLGFFFWRESTFDERVRKTVSDVLNERGFPNANLAEMYKDIGIKVGKNGPSAEDLFRQLSRIANEDNKKDAFKDTIDENLKDEGGKKHE